MKISIFTTITDPEYRQDAWREAITNYMGFADEVIVVYGKSEDRFLLESLKNDKLKAVYCEWPIEWKWGELPKHLARGFRECKGDVMIKCDIDYFFHEKDFKQLRLELEALYNKGFEVAGMVKLNVINKHVGMIKTRTPNIISRDVKDKIIFGEAVNKKTDWCEPLKVKGCCKESEAEAYLTYPVVTPWVYNYDNFFKTREIVERDFWRMAKAYASVWGWKWGNNKDEAFKVWLTMQNKRVNAAGELVSHPKVLQEKINSMTPDMWGYNNWK